MYDLIIQNGWLLDGTGGPAYRADIGIRAGRIARIAKGLQTAARIIDATGLTVTPGFIDSHSHADQNVLLFPDQKEKIEQGITTSIAGQCGISPAPIEKGFFSEETVGNFGKKADVYRTVGTFLQTLTELPLGANLAVFAGHGALRKAVMGTENRVPSPDELEQMKALLQEAIDAGALGVSFGLIYTPSCYAQTEELIALAKVAGDNNALVSAHIRNEGDTLINATEEFISVIRASGARGILSHHKAAGKENWGKVHHTLSMIEDANREGLEIYCDVYPYCASHTSLVARFIPKELRAGGTSGIVSLLSDTNARQTLKAQLLDTLGDDLNWVLVTDCYAHPEYEGLRLPQIAALRGTDAYDAAFDLIRDCKTNCHACYFTMCEADVEAVLAHPRAMLCTDAGVAGESKCYHPRLRASFPRALGEYIRKRHTVSLPEMIRKMTAMPAAVYGLSRKGLLAEGFDADICIFDAEKIQDRADYTNCTAAAEGLNYVILGGETVVENARHNGIRPGRLLLRTR